MAYPEYRPRSPEILAVLQALPSTVAEQVCAGRGSQLWIQQLLTRMVYLGVCRRTGPRYYLMYPVQSAVSLTDPVEQLLREHGAQTVAELQLHGVARCRIHSTLRTLEARGRVVVDSTVRPFRYAVAAP
jgi:hypothetical protein